MNSNIKPTGASTSVAGISRTYKRILRQSFFMVIFDKRFDAAISQTSAQCNTADRISVSKFCAFPAFGRIFFDWQPDLGYGKRALRPETDG